MTNKKNSKPLPVTEREVNETFEFMATLLAVEFGYKQCEKGLSLEAALKVAEKCMTN